MRASRWLVAIVASLFALFAAVMALASSHSAYLLATAAVLAITIAATRLSAHAQGRGDLPRSFGWMYTAYVAAVCITGIAVFPAIDRWHDLGQLAVRIHKDGEHCSLALLNPDETTIAMLDDRLRTPFTILDSDASGDSPERLVSDWFNTHGAAGCVLVLLPGHAPGELTRLLDHVHRTKPADDGLAGMLRSRGIASVLHRYDIPQGRRYALLARPDAVAQER
jgi:hypothetical protein